MWYPHKDKIVYITLIITFLDLHARTDKMNVANIIWNDTPKRNIK